MPSAPAPTLTGVKWCDECQRPVDTVDRPLSIEREGSGQERTVVPLVDPACQNDPGDWSHTLRAIPPEIITDAVDCPNCEAKRGRACDTTSGHVYEGTEVHRGRWLKFERDLRTNRLSFPPPRPS